MHDYVIRHGIVTNVRTNKQTWFRLYKSGWVEQGGRFDCSGLHTGNGSFYEADFICEMPLFNNATVFSIEKGVVSKYPALTARLAHLSTACRGTHVTEGKVEQIYGEYGMKDVCWKIAGKRK